MRKRIRTNKRKKKVLVAVAAACLLSGGFIVYAINDTKLSRHEDNLMFPAEIEIAVQENGASDTDPTAEKTLQWQAEDGRYSAKKKVQIINVDQETENNADAYIRVCIIPRWTATVEGTEVDVINTASGLSEFGSLTEIVIQDHTYIMGDVAFTLAEDWDEYWLFNPKDGYFYYRSSISPGDTTAPLLSNVSITEETWKKITKTDDGTTDVIELKVDILADSIQTVGGAVETRWGASGIGIDPKSGELTLSAVSGS